MKKIILLILMFVSTHIYAANLLDFEAEVIEGEKKRPELFLDIKAGDGNVGSGMYLRSHFDDFFYVDRSRHPQFVKAK